MRAAFRLTVATPLSVGWYEPGKLDEMWYLRPSSIKGLWRWWARAFVGGILYERGCLKSRGRKEVLRVPDEASARRISEIVGRDLGLGYAGEEEKSVASKFKISVRTLSRPQVYTASKGRGIRWNLQRLKLLSLGKEVQYAEGGEFELDVEAHGVDRKVFTTSVGILAIALTLEGVGKGSRKGLGSLDVIRISGDFTARPLPQLVEEVRRSLDGIIGDRCGETPRELPPMPIVSRKMGISSIHTAIGVDFPVLHNFFLRSQRARVLHGHFAAEDDLRRDLNEWVLGLPREQKGTGYGIDAREVNRRASTIMLSYHGPRHALNPRGEPTGYLTILVSADWPTHLTWSDGQEEITIDESRISRAYETAYKEFAGYVGKLGGRVDKIWP